MAGGGGRFNFLGLVTSVGLVCFPTAYVSWSIVSAAGFLTLEVLICFSEVIFSSGFVNWGGLLAFWSHLVCLVEPGIGMADLSSLEVVGGS